MAVDEGAENMVHHCLKSGGRIGESEVHDHWFPDPETGLERSLPLVAIAYAYVVVSPSNVEGGENEGVC